MKTSQEHIRQLMLEELNTMVENGELSEEQMDEIFKQLGGAIKGAGRGLRSLGRHIKRGWKQGAAQAAAGKAAKVGGAPVAAPAAAVAPSAQQPVQVATTSPVPQISPDDEKTTTLQRPELQQKQKELITKSFKNFANDYKSLGGDPNKLNGHVLVYKNNQLIPLPPSSKLARDAFSNTFKTLRAANISQSKPATPVPAAAQPATQSTGKTTGVDGPELGEPLEENISTIYENWKKLAGLIKG